MMCGINGVFNFKKTDNVSKKKLKEMTSLLMHRGPDESYCYFNKNIGLGFNRLSIIDLETGSQPIHSTCGRYTLIFNGEIYNYKELRDELRKKGVTFKTNSDSEVILNLIITENYGFEKKLSGMFAFAFFDQKLNRLLLVRDRFGKKPLFWMKTKLGIAFASEIKSLLILNKTNCPDYSTISDFLTLGYCPSPKSAFKNINQLKAGSSIYFSKNIKSYIWWQNPSLTEKDKPKIKNFEKIIYDNFIESVERRLISDVPIGLFLSGGLDSTLILSAIKKIGLPKGFKTFTAKFKSKSYDESIQASYIADYYNVENEQIEISPYDIPEIFEDVVYKSDNLIGNPAIFANYILSKFARKEVKVALNGGGGDELFFGYHTYKADFISEFFNYLPPFILSFFKKSIAFLPTSHKKLNFKYRATKFFEGVNLNRLERHYSWRTILNHQEKRDLFPNHTFKLNSYASYENAYNEFKGDDFYEQVAFADMKVWWQDMGLYQGDSMSMANSLELRMPFMDHQLIEVVSKIPRKIKFKNGNLKMFYKNICKQNLPKKIINQPKSGFHLPLAEWFSNELKLFIYDKLSYRRIKNIDGLNYLKVKEIIENHINKKEDNSFKICNLLVFVEWYTQFCKD